MTRKLDSRKYPSTTARPSRRQFLKQLGAVAALTMLAGCGGGEDADASTSTTPTVSATVPAPLPAGLPDWVSALTPGQWYEIPNTAMSSVAPSPTPLGWNGPTAKVDSWNSFVVNTRTSKVYSLANGGHYDYAGNEVDVLDLELAQPRWTELLAPTSNAEISASASVPCSSYYVDGRPTSRHSYYGVTLNEFDDRIMLFGGAHWCAAGGFHKKVDSYNIGSNSWSPADTHPDAPGLAGHAMSVDPSTGDVYMHAQYSLRRWNRSSNTWTEINPAGGVSTNGYYAMSAFDTARGRVLFLSDQVRHVYSVADNTFSPVTLSGPDAATVQVVRTAMVYVPALDRFLVRLSGAGGAVYEIHPTTFEVKPFWTSGGDAVPATLYGPFNKFLYVPRLHGAVYVPTHGGNAWFLRIH